MCPNSEERKQQGYVNIIRKGVNKVVKTDDGYHVEDEYEKLNALEKMKLLIEEGALDLHIHTNASDGFDSPPSALTHVMKLNLKTFSITDHDTLWGVKDVLMIIEKLKQMRVDPVPRFIPGVELSVEMENRELHLLGYFPNGGQNKIQNFLENVKQSRIERNKLLCARLTELGLPMSYKGLTKEGGQVIGRVHVATTMARLGYVSSVEAAFDEYLGEGKPAYIDRGHPSIEEGIKVIKDAGGISVLAHPKLYGWLDGPDAEKLLFTKLKRLKSMGCHGIEVVHGQTSLKESALVSDLAKRLGLLRTIGSDYHGKNKLRVDMYTADQDFSEYLID